MTACLAMGADVDAQSDGGHTPLHRAASVSTSPAVLEELLDAGADIQAQTGRDGSTTSPRSVRKPGTGG